MDGHRGEIVEKIVRKKGYPIAVLAKRLYMSRNTLYKRFDTSSLSYEFILSVGRIIGYDFSSVFPALAHSKKVSQDTLWRTKDKYIKLLESYTDLLVIAAKTLALTDVEGVRKQIAEFIKEEWVQ